MGIQGLFDPDTGFPDLQSLARLAALGATQLQCAHRVHALDDLTEDGVLAIEPGCGDESQEELAAVGARSGIGHAEEAGAVVLDTGIELPVVLIAGAAGPGPQRTAPLRHEVADDAMEGQAIVEPQPREIERTGNVYRRHVYQQPDGDSAEVGVEVPVVALGGVKAEDRRPRQARFPAWTRRVDGLRGNEAVYGLQRWLVDGGLLG